MTQIEFVSQLVVKFAPKIKDTDSDGVKLDKKEEKDQFFNDLNSFSSECLHDRLQDVFNFVSRHHEYNTIPKMAMFWKYANKCKIIKKKDKRRDPIWNVCTNCGVKYSKLGRGCPECRKVKAFIDTTETVPEDLINVQEDCFYCIDIYPETLKKGMKLSGPDCGDYGKKITPHCKDCICKECCKQMILYNSNPELTTLKYKTTELAQPWLTDVKPLNETLKQMVKDMKKGVEINNIMR